MSNTSCDDPRSYSLLAQLLDTPATLGLADRSALLDSFKRALTAAMQLPPGDSRQALLATLNGAISDAIRRRDYYRDKQILVEQLRSSYPCASEIRDTSLSIQSLLQTIQDAAEDAQNKEAERGVNPLQTSWPAFRHELERLASIIANRIQTLERTVDVTVLPEPADPAHPPYEIAHKEAYQ